ncbi:MAG: leucine-rich repeat domain-containing protein [Muribaculaceae bacterium]|nr:leucine-rich repeat domain-containing protein [Muribaculaceae bacterium]
MRKKILLFLSAAIMSSLPIFARDIEYEYKGQTLTYTVLDENAKTVETKEGGYSYPGNNVQGELVIPSQIEDGDEIYTVTSIGYCSFKNCSKLTSISFPDGLASIGGSAFEGCSGLSSISLPDGLTTIGSAAFNGGSGLRSIAFPYLVG